LSYYYASTQSLPLEETQTYAFTAWIIGHVMLAFVSRSDVDPLRRLGFLSNRVMDYWAIAVMIFLALAMSVPQIWHQLKITPLSLEQIAVIAGICALTITWQEIGKMLIDRRKRE
jgi:Ca2+-transporting ATPase